MIRDVDHASGIDGEIADGIELPFPNPVAAPGMQKPPLRVEDLDAAVFPVGDVDEPRGVDRDAARFGERSRFRTGDSPLQENRAVGAECLDAVVEDVRDVDTAVRRHSDITEEATFFLVESELARLRAGLAPQRECIAFRVENLDLEPGRGAANDNRRDRTAGG